MNHNVMMAQAQAQAQVFQTRALPKKTDNAPQYDGKLKDDLELYLFATEKFYSEFRDLMNANTSESVDMIFCNFGPVVRTFLREVSHSLTRVDGIRDPLTWALCKDRLRPRFRDEHVIPSFNGRLEQAQPPFPERLPKSRHLATPERLCQAPSHGGVVRAIVGRRERKGATFFKVRWYGQDEPDTWKPVSNMTQAQGLIDEFVSSTMSPVHSRS
ncbi:hypothetical protein PF007_g14964 [Phytophthora fragariae]|uniref:Chromo domain-containing protein n=1 Tax=Phytophthora fragariae TaxID=53985 RepID=A0A6A3RRS7_9STRA|nr:hypothetical protein PF007_g14964 [Phytophthora fragariae]